MKSDTNIRAWMLRPIVSAILLMLPMGCMGPKNDLHLELIAYYTVFNLNPFLNTNTRLAAVAIPIEACSDFSYGDSVTVSFSVREDRLFPIKIAGYTSGTIPKLSLVGKFIGCQSDDSMCFAGFPFAISQDEYDSMEYSHGITLYLDAVFTVTSDSALKFNSLTVISRQNKEPMRFK
jgi:hypothetical protein